MNETKIPEPTPEQLLKLLDLQLGTARAKRPGPHPSRRVATLTVALLLILSVCCAALFFLKQMIADLPRREAGATPDRATPQGGFANLKE